MLSGECTAGNVGGGWQAVMGGIVARKTTYARLVRHLRHALVRGLVFDDIQLRDQLPYGLQPVDELAVALCGAEGNADDGTRA